MFDCKAALKYSVSMQVAFLFLIGVTYTMSHKTCNTSWKLLFTTMKLLVLLVFNSCC